MSGGPQAVQAFDHPRRLLPGATQDDDVGFKQDGVGGREQREQGRLAPEATGRDPQRDRGAGEQGLTESLRRRHVPVTARHGGNADPGEGDLDPGQDVAVGAVARATPAPGQLSRAGTTILVRAWTRPHHLPR